MTVFRPKCLAASVALALAGCANITGFDATSEYACKAPAGIKCDSVSGTYANALQNNLPSQRPQRAPASTTTAATAAPAPRAIAASAAVVAPTVPPVVQSIRSQPRLLRLWIKPWEDADRDLHDQGYVYVQVDSGRWLIDHAQRRIRDAYAPVRPPRPAASGAAEDRTPLPRSSTASSADDSAATDAIRALQATVRPAQQRGAVD